jgi:uncharacterized MAPEG superfamily protein
MTIALSMAAWALALAFAQILLFDIARTRQYGLKWNTGPRDDEMPPLSPLAQRLKRAQDNLFETLPLFVGAVRVAYVPLYAFGVRQIRSLVWLVSIVGLGMVGAGVLGA